MQSLQLIIIKRKNLNNEKDTETVSPSIDGIVKFTNAVPDDTQTLSIIPDIIDSSTSIESSSVSMIPSYDGENLGTLPILTRGMYGFKTTYKIDGDDLGFCYGNQYKFYNLELNFNNIGDIVCSTSIYNISSTDSKLEFISGPINGNFESILPGSSKTIQLKIRYGEILTEYVDVPIDIEITDSEYERTWNDKVIIRFYKGFVSLFINSINFDNNSTDMLNGFFIYPDGRSKRFTVVAGVKTTVLLPWCKNNYLLVFSGAKETNEMGYSFCFDDMNNLADLTGVWTINEINAFENNDDSNNPYQIIDSNQTIKAYLKADDIDYYALNIQKNNTNYKPIIVDDYLKVNNIESIECGYDIRIHNVDNKIHENIVATISSVSPLITVKNNVFEYGILGVNLYKTCYYVSNWVYGGLNEYGSYPGTWYTYVRGNNGFQTIKNVKNEGFELRSPGFSIELLASGDFNHYESGENRQN